MNSSASTCLFLSNDDSHLVINVRCYNRNTERMGVKELWPLLESAKQLKHFEEMKGETVAVDLSMWIVDSQCVKQMHGAVKKPHLR